MKLFLIGKFLRTGSLTGPERYSSDLFNLLKNDDEVFAYEYFDDGNKYSTVEKIFGKDRIANRFQMTGIIPFVSEMAAKAPGIVHITGYQRFAAFIAILKWFFEFKLVYTCHGIAKKENREKPGTSIFYKLKDAICEKLIIQSADEIIVFSDVTKKSIQCFYPGKRNIRMLTPTPGHYDDVNKKHNGNEHKLTLVCYGNNYLRENAAVELLKIFDALHDKIEIRLIGFSPGFRRKANLMSAVYYDVLPEKEWRELLGNSDLFLIPYAGETFSYSGLDALAAGCIPVYNKSAGISRILTDGINGIAFSSNATEELSSVIRKLAETKDLLDSYRQNAVALIAKNSPEGFIGEHKKLYNSIHGTE